MRCIARSTRERLLREARAAAALNHTNSVAIDELGEAEGIAYIAMEAALQIQSLAVTGRREVGESTRRDPSPSPSWVPLLIVA